MSKTVVTMWLCVVGMVLGASVTGWGAPLGTAIIYQGRLTDQGSPASEPYDFVFRLYDASSGGNLLGTDTATNVTPQDGYFKAELDFGSGVFAGEARWLEIRVASAGSGSYTTLSPRQEMTPTPYALYALNAPDGGGNTLDQAYDQGGPGSGRTITADAGPVNIAGPDGLSVLSADSSDGEAILGQSTAATGQRFGVRGVTQSTHPFASGVHGRMIATSGLGSGVWGRTLSTTGRGVFGEAYNTTGANYGVYGKTWSSDGYGGYFVGRGYFSGDVGIGTTSPGSPLTVDGMIESLADGIKFPDGTVQTTALSAGAAAGRNPLQIALLRWYEANESGASFGVGSVPVAVAFDGANVWVANNNSGTVTKLRASDGAVLGTFYAGGQPYGVAFDGANIWVANYGNNTVSKL